MTFEFELKDSFLAEKGKFFGDLEAGYDYFEIDYLACTQVKIQLDGEVRGNLFKDFYDHIDSIPAKIQTKEFLVGCKFFQDDSIRRSQDEVPIHNSIVNDFAESMLTFYNESEMGSYYYTLLPMEQDPEEDPEPASTLVRFKVNDQFHSLDTYNTIDNNIAIAEYSNYETEETRNINLLGQDFITVLNKKFKVDKVYFKTDKISKVNKLITVVKIARFYFGEDCHIPLT